MLTEEITITLRPRSLLIGLLLSPIAVLLGWWVWSWNWSSNNAPAWVQAVGSVAALVVAFGVAIYQNSQRLAETRRQDKDLMDRVVSLADWIATVVRNADACLRAATPNYELVVGLEGRLNKAERLLDQLTIAQIPQIEAALGWEELRSAVVGMQGHMRVFQADGLDGRGLYKMGLTYEKALLAYKRIWDSRKAMC